MACHTVRAVGWHPEGEEGGEDGVGRWGGGYRDWRGTAPKVPAGIRRESERERETEVRGFGGRQAGRQADWKEPADSEIRA